MTGAVAASHEPRASRAGDEPRAARTPPVRLAALDGLRGIAALVVALHHIFFHFAPWPYAPGPLGPLVDWIAHSGWTLVDLFFILSGFVFAHVYLSSDVLSTSAGRADFAVARFARLYPLHFAVLVLFLVLQPDNPYNTAAAFAGHMAMLQAFIPHAGATFDCAAWSLSIEAACYVIFVIAAAAGRRVLLVATAAFALLGGVLLALFGATGDPIIADMLRRGLFGFFIGQGMWHLRGHLFRIPSWALGVALVAGIGLQVSLPVMPVLPLGLLAWPAALLLVLRMPWLASRPILWLGDRSYAIYLLNLAVITFAILDLGLKGSALSPAAVAGVEVAMVAAILVLSDLSFRFLERPARRAIRAAWDNRRRAGAAAGLPAGAA